ncbi:MAG: hypothetical protein UDH96_02680, partial [Megasphaera elsdenii]|nr:hypothetical protein [Megasphaera elsdenii]
MFFGIFKEKPPFQNKNERYEQINYITALYNFYATSEVDETSLHKACTKSVGFFTVWALETKVPKN